MSNYRVAFISLGCAKNLVNTEQMAALVREAGHTIVPDPEGADVCVLNTCGFIDSAKSEAIDHILELARLKDAGQLKKILVAGCLSQRYREDIRTELTIPLAYLSTVAAMSALCGQNVLTQLLSGGLLLGAFFMATDYTTSPFTRKGKLIFGVGCGLITCAIRFWGNMNEGVSYSILLMNLTVPYINAKTRKTPMGGEKRK